MVNERLVVVLSDIEMGNGKKVDDFLHTNLLVEFIRKYQAKEYKTKEVDLVFNGDSFDFLKTPVNGNFPHLIDADIALKKLEIISKAHKNFFDALGEFVESSTKPRRVHFVVGNHDMELFFPEVQNKIIQLCGGSGQIQFPGLTLTIGDLHIEHGNQHDSLFSLNPLQPFISYKGKDILNLPWATVTLLNAVLPLHDTFCELDRIKPRHEIFQKAPVFKEFLMGELWKYWTDDFVNDFIRSDDPLKKVSWSMVKEALKRSFFFNPDVEVGNLPVEIITKRTHANVYVIGHMHEPKLNSYGNRKIIQSGCLRDEYMMDEAGEVYTPIAKGFLEIHMKKNQVVRTIIDEIEAPKEMYNRMPKPIKFYARKVEKLLGDEKERLQNRIEIEEQEIKEANEE